MTGGGRAAALLISLLSVALLPSAARAGDSSALLPGVSVRLKAARYASSGEDLRWLGWVGAGAGLLRVEGATAYLTGDVETVAGDVREVFDAHQANYHLEVGAARSFGRWTANLVFHHVSRHDLDRPKEQVVDWNILGGRASVRLREGSSLPLRLVFGIGHTTQVSLVGYQWEVTGRVEVDLVSRGWGSTYAISDVRMVTTTRSEAFPRSAFVDLMVEGGLRWGREGRRLGAFAAFEHRNDVFLEASGARDRALFGIRVDSSPAGGSY